MQPSEPSAKMSVQNETGATDPAAASSTIQAAEAVRATIAAAVARRRAAKAAVARAASADLGPPEPLGAALASADYSSVGGGDQAERNDEAVDMEGLSEVAGESGARILVAAGVRTVRQLADQNEEDLARKLKATEGRTSQGGPEPEGEVEGDTAREEISEEAVSEWIQAARGEELDEIMAELVGGDEDVVEVSGAVLRPEP